MIDLKEKVKKFPSTPGVYLMKDASGHIIYVGKSKNLKSRVSSYLINSKSHSPKVVKLVKQIRDIEYRVTDTEFEAFLLECQLIKELKPHFNKLMKNPKSYIYIEIGMEKVLPTIKMTYEKNNATNLYFGPFTSKNTVEKAIAGLKEFYQMNCNQPKKSNSPCLNYSLGMCMGTCFNPANYQQYITVIQRVIRLLEHGDSTILDDMEEAMVNLSVKFDFESATKIRDTINAIHSLLNKEKVIEFAKENEFIVVMEPIDEQKFKLFLIHNTKVVYQQLLSMNDLNCSSIASEINNHITITEPLLSIQKDMIDEAQIIYSYLKSNACKYFIIPKTMELKDIHKAMEDVLTTSC
ncbi:GIY-YIG nuclease family protein [Lysinibacillus antri]|uniref:GIY-YIG nuclease family protein n=1 Tax=Lysinibacillus antri TaxID=2498145 RepID=UPI001C551675|nr:GIY-YIG nuclease family protein [Lysinibacillus antri]